MKKKKEKYIIKYMTVNNINMPTQQQIDQIKSDIKVLKQLHSMLEIGNGKNVDEPTSEEIQKKIKLIVDRIK